MGNPYLQMYKDVVNEVGTEIIPIDFGFCEAGQTTDLGYDLLFYNDKDGSQNSEDAKEIKVELLRMYLTEKFNGDGNPDQSYFVSSPEVVSDIYTEEEITVDGKEWVRVASFLGYSSDSEIYLFDYVLGKVTFGDGSEGKKPPIGVNNIEIAYTPNLNIYGKTIWENKWLEIKSNGVITAEIHIGSGTPKEEAIKIDNTTVEVIHYPLLTAVTGVWDNPNGTGINYYVSFNANTGIITTDDLTGISNVYVEYKYQAKSDNEGAYIKLGNGIQKSLEHRLPRQNAKKLQLRMVVPEIANSEGGANIKIVLKVYYSF